MIELTGVSVSSRDIAELCIYQHVVKGVAGELQGKYVGPLFCDYYPSFDSISPF